MKGRIAAFLFILFVGIWLVLSEHPSGSVAGTVNTREGTPIAQARVIFSGPSSRTVTTDKNGHFRADRLTTGRYVVVARAKGFDSQWMTPAVEVKEGQTSSGIKFALMRREPTLFFANYQKVFTPKEPVRIGIRGTLIERMAFELYRIDLKTWMKDRDSLDTLQRLGPQDRSRFSKVREWIQTVPDNAYDEDDWFYRQIQIPKDENGAYLLIARGYYQGRIVKEETTWFNRTRLALVAKRSPSQLLLYAVDMLTNKPLEGVKYRVLGSRGTVLAGSTKTDGLSLMSFQGEERVTILGETEDSLATLISYYYADNRPYQVYSYTDRPVYRPAQTVYFKGIVAQNKRVSQGTAVHIRIKDPSDTVIADQTRTTDGYGGYSGNIQLPAEARLGNYSLETTIGKMSEYSNFSVLEYRKNEYKLDIQPDRKRYIAGDTIQAKVQASYYFGGPVPGTRLRYTVYSTPKIAVSEDETFYYGFEGEGDGWGDMGYGDVVTQGEAVTNDEGNVNLSIPTKRLDAQMYEQTYDQNYAIEVEAVEVSQRPIKGKASVLVARGLLDVEAETDSFVYAPGDTVKLTTNVTDLDGNPAGIPASVTLSKQETRRGEEGETISYRSLWSQQVKKGSLTFKAPEEGYYNLTIQVLDSQGHIINQQVGLWVAKGEFTTSYRYGLRLIFDKKTYRPGDTAKIIVSAPTDQAPVLLTQETQSIRSARLLPMGASNRVIEIPITRAFEPNVFLCATLIDGKSFYQAERSLNVTPEENFLKVQITSDRKRYQPGDKVKLSVKLTDAQNKPVRGAFSLGVVDEAIYAVMPDETPDIRRFFQGPANKQVSTSYSFPEEYSGGPSKDLFQPSVRENFKDTAAWFPSLVTDANGNAQVSFNLPDNLTTWVATVRASTPRLQVGSSVSTFIETKNLLVRLLTPRFLVEGDRARLGGIVHNNTERPQDLRISLQGQNLRLESERPIYTQIAPGDLSSSYWWVNALQPATASATFKAQGLGLGDAMKMSFPVLPHAIQQGTAQSGGMESAESSLTVNIPANTVPGSLKTRLEIIASPLQAIQGALRYLKAYPYGCTEQTTSRFLPEAVTSQTMRKLGIKGPKLSKQETQQALSTLYRLQHSDGGWGWWDFGDSEPEMTAYALEGLASAKQAGIPVSQDALQGGIRYLKQLKLTDDVIRRYTLERGAGEDAKAMKFYALSLFGEYSPEKIRLNSLSNAGKALLALGQYHLNQRDAADEVLKRLDSAVTQSQGAAHWKANAVQYSWSDSDILTTSLILQAYALIRPTDPKMPKILRWLLGQKQGESWGNTKDTSHAVLALDQYMLAYPPKPEGVTVKVTLNGRQLINGPLPSNSAPMVLHPGLRGGQNRVALSASQPVAYSLTTTYLQKKNPIPAENKPGLSLERRMYTLSRKQLIERKLGKLKPLSGNLGLGEMALVELRVTNHEPLRYLILESPLPGGAETLEQTPEDWSNWYSHQEIHDNRVSMFFSELPAGTHRFYYAIRAELPGRYRILPAQISSMYLTEIRASTAEASLDIR